MFVGLIIASTRKERKRNESIATAVIVATTAAAVLELVTIATWACDG